jgi:uncharacterized membrane protein YidH (DUF202 family)
LTRRAGRQAERTTLAWQRTALGLLANGGLFVLRDAGAPLPTIGSMLLAGTLLVLAAVVAGIGRRREQVLSRPTVPSGLPPSTEVTIIGCLMVAVSVGAVVLLALS